MSYFVPPHELCTAKKGRGDKDGMAVTVKREEKVTNNGREGKTVFIKIPLFSLCLPFRLS